MARFMGPNGFGPFLSKKKLKIVVVTVYTYFY